MPAMPRDARPSEEDEDRFVGRPCYAFNPSLRANLDDTRCSHCRFYLTARCPHIDEFLDDVDDLSPE
jgi:hypothetical protein